MDQARFRADLSLTRQIWPIADWRLSSLSMAKPDIQPEILLKDLPLVASIGFAPMVQGDGVGSAAGGGAVAALARQCRGGRHL